jgi:hypothetical protein
MSRYEFLVVAVAIVMVFLSSTFVLIVGLLIKVIPPCGTMSMTWSRDQRFKKANGQGHRQKSKHRTKSKRKLRRPLVASLLGANKVLRPKPFLLVVAAEKASVTSSFSLEDVGLFHQHLYNNSTVSLRGRCPGIFFVRLVIVLMFTMAK